MLHKGNSGIVGTPIDLAIIVIGYNFCCREILVQRQI